MKKLIISLCLLALLTGCTTHTSYGECVGIDSSDRDPNLHYKLNAWNLAMGIIFFETIVVPVVVVVDDVYCPVRNNTNVTKQLQQH